jgi:exosortase
MLQDVDAKPGLWRLQSVDALVAGPIVFLALTLYFSVFVKLVHDWFTLPDFSHGAIVPFFVGFLIWRRRDVFRSLPMEQSWAGLWLLIPGLGLLLLGVLGAELFLARVSFLFVVGGSIWLLMGRRYLLELKFPFLVAFLGIPMPQVIFNQITLPLQLLASDIASTVLPLFHVPVLRNGNIIQLPAFPLEVAEACSGIRSLMSLFTLAVLYGYFAEHKLWKRVLLALASVPIAVLANAIRIIGTGLLVQFWNPERALGFFHEFSGVLMFVVSLTSLFGLHTLMNSRPRWA